MLTADLTPFFTVQSMARSLELSARISCERLLMAAGLLDTNVGPVSLFPFSV